MSRMKRPSPFRVLIVLALFVATSAVAQTKFASAPIDEALRRAVAEQHIPGIVAAVARGNDIVYTRAFGKASDTKTQPMAEDSIFAIASMTKAVTTIAVLQLVERGKVKLDEPASTYVPELARVQVLEGFDDAGKPKLRPPKSAVTVRQLLTHTSGFAYEFFDEKMARYVKSGAIPSAMGGGDAWLNAPLMFDPGTAFEYGISIDWLGRLVEKVSGRSLEDYFHENIFVPLGMKDSFFNVPPDKQSRMVALHSRKPDGTFGEAAPQPVKPVTFFSGGGGLHSTASDYLKLTRMLLAEGKLGNARILQARTVAMMRRNQIGDLRLGSFKSLLPEFARDGVAIPGSLDKFGFGFAINTQAVEGGRGAGSMAWAGIFNTFFWVDPEHKTTAVLMMQILPFLDDGPKTVLEQFEKAVYATQQ
jgi:CubicO group peptidase (beta-lactamase class C family)